jgi:Beta-lactamase enzyme family
VISWAVSDGREQEGDRVVPAASTIKPIIASAFWRSGLDPAERVDVPAVPWSVADALEGRPTLADCALLMLAFSDNAATNVLLDRLGFAAVNAEATRLGCEQTQIRRPMMTPGPQNLTCAIDLVRALIAIDDERVFDALERAHDSELPLRVPGRRIAVKTGELAPLAYHEAALVDGTLAVAVCSAPAALPHEVAAVAAGLIA